VGRRAGTQRSGEWRSQKSDLTRSGKTFRSAHMLCVLVTAFSRNAGIMYSHLDTRRPSHHSVLVPLLEFGQLHSLTFNRGDRSSRATTPHASKLATYSSSQGLLTYLLFASHSHVTVSKVNRTTLPRTENRIIANCLIMTADYVRVGNK